jgi:hypothetical protein
MNLNTMGRAYLLYGLQDGDYLVLDYLPDGSRLTAGELNNTHAICDISHWTQADLDEFSEMGTGDQYAIVEQLELAVFAQETRGN